MRIYLLIPRPGKDAFEVPLSLVNNKAKISLSSADKTYAFKIELLDGGNLEVTDYQGKKEVFTSIQIGERLECKFLTLQLKEVIFALAIRAE